MTLALQDTADGLRVRCFGGCSGAAVMAELKRRGLIDAATPRGDGGRKAAKPSVIEGQIDRARRIAAARWLWGETEPANWLIATYLGGRIILGPIPKAIRLHRRLWHREANVRRPAMVCAVMHAEHGFVGLHCTYLAANGEGKATAIEPVKRFIGPVGGGAVRLGSPNVGSLAVAEGVENGLSYMQATGTPTWAAMSAGGLRSLVLPDAVRAVVIAPDADPVGIMAARAAARRWLAEGRRVSIARPPVGQDFNDMTREALDGDLRVAGG